ncbi:Uncharacterised protein [Bordetella pertussis]|nr:Uncharacterised protein [Bordetella pertussis]
MGTSRPLSVRRSRPTRSMDSLISVSHTSPLGPARLAKARARSPVPPAMSSTFMPGRTAARPIVKAFQTRCRPADMRSFMTS